MEGNLFVSELGHIGGSRIFVSYSLFDREDTAYKSSMVVTFTHIHECLWLTKYYKLVVVGSSSGILEWDFNRL